VIADTWRHWKYLHDGTAVRYWFWGLLLIALINSFGRSWMWNYEWLWAMDTLAFSSVFIVPLCAGISAYEIGNLSKARDLHSTSPRAVTSLLRIGALVWLAAIAVVMISAFAIGGRVYYQIHELPRASDFLSLLPLLTSLAIGCAVGILVGWFTSSRMTPGIVALGVFAIIMAGYIAGGRTSAALVSVGGATGSLVGLRLSISFLLWQCAFYLALTTAVLWVIKIRMDSVKRWHRGVTIACVALPLALALAVPNSGERFQRVPERNVVCSGSRPQICLANEYASQTSSIRAHLEPYFVAFSEAGIEKPSRVVQAGLQEQRDDLQVESLDLVTPNSQRIKGSLVTWLDRNGCSTWGGDEADDPARVIWDWLGLRGEGSSTRVAPNVDLRSMTAEQQNEALRNAVHQLEQCKQR